jgi:hypothetical protein
MRIDSVIKESSVLKTVKDTKELTIPKAGKTYVDRSGNKVDVKLTDRFNIIYESQGETFVRVINGKAVFLSGENKKPLPFGMSVRKAEESFGKESKGNIFIDSKDSSSKANNSVAIESPKSYFGGVSDKSLAFRSKNAIFAVAANGCAIDSDNAGFFLSHNCRIINSPGKPRKIDPKTLEELCLKYSEGGTIRKALLLGSGTIIVNSDDVNLNNSPGIVLSCEFFKAHNSPNFFAEESSDGVRLLNSGGVNIINVNCDDNSKVVIKNSPGLSAKDSAGIKVKDCPDAVLDGADYANLNKSEGVKVIESRRVKASGSSNSSIVKSSEANLKNSSGVKANVSSGIEVTESPNAVFIKAHDSVVKNSEGLNIKKSINVKASNSGNSIISGSNGAELKNSPNSTHSGSIGSKSINSPGSEIKNGDKNTIDNSPDATITDSYGALIKNSEGAGAYDAQALEMINCPGTRAETVQKSKITGLKDKEITNRPHTVLTAKDADSFPAAKKKYKARPGVEKSTV